MQNIIPFKSGSNSVPLYVDPIRVEVLGTLKDSSSARFPLYLSKISAGFPSPADDYVKDHITLQDLVQSNPASSFIVQAHGNSMIGAGIKDKSYLIVDRSLSPQNGDIVVVSINNEHTVKTYKRTCSGKVFLCPENPDYKAIELTEELDNILFGVVTGILILPRK